MLQAEQNNVHIREISDEEWDSISIREPELSPSYMLKRDLETKTRELNSLKYQAELIGRVFNEWRALEEQTDIIKKKKDDYVRDHTIDGKLSEYDEKVSKQIYSEVFELGDEKNILKAAMEKQFDRFKLGVSGHTPTFEESKSILENIEKQIEDKKKEIDEINKSLNTDDQDEK